MPLVSHCVSLFVAENSEVRRGPLSFDTAALVRQRHDPIQASLEVFSTITLSSGQGTEGSLVVNADVYGFWLVMHEDSFDSFFDSLYFGVNDVGVLSQVAVALCQDCSEPMALLGDEPS